MARTTWIGGEWIYRYLIVAGIISGFAFIVVVRAWTSAVLTPHPDSVYPSISDVQLGGGPWFWICALTFGLNSAIWGVTTLMLAVRGTLGDNLWSLGLALVAWTTLIHFLVESRSFAMIIE